LDAFQTWGDLAQPLPTLLSKSDRRPGLVAPGPPMQPASSGGALSALAGTTLLHVRIHDEVADLEVDMRGQSVKPAVGDGAPELNLPTEAGTAFSLTDGRPPDWCRFLVMLLDPSFDYERYL
jgi:hypothetical protein